jgi:hypothetical protein
LPAAQAGPFPQLFRTSSSGNQWEKLRAASQVPLDQLPPALRPKVQRVLEHPILYSQGPQESFVCQPKFYAWLLDHPDRATTAWRRLGAKCLDITDRGNGQFGWSDGKGSEVIWRTLVPNPNLRIWYAEGQVKPGAVLPTVPVQCVVILRHDVVRPQDGAAIMEHQADVFVYSDSRAAALAIRILGPSVPRLAEQGTAQLQMFYAALAWYCHKHPERTKVLFQPNGSESPSSLRLYSPLEASPVAFPAPDNLGAR